MDGGGRDRLGDDENIARTYREAEPCGYVVSGAGAGARFCDRPAIRGSYCRDHAALCQVRPGTDDAARIVAEQEREAGRNAWPRPEGAPLPPPGLAEDPEPLEPTEPEEIVAALDLPPREAEDA